LKGEREKTRRRNRKREEVGCDERERTTVYDRV
jgi:hypothetical protein